MKSLTLRPTRRQILKGMTGAAAGSVISKSLFPAPAYAKDLKGSGSVAVFDGGGGWGAALRQAYFEPFEKEIGIKVIPQPRTPTGVMRAGVLSGTPKYDVMSLSGGAYYSFAGEGLLLPVDYGWWEAADREAIAPVPTLEFGVPNEYYSLIIGYDEAVHTARRPANWADIWNAQDLPGGRTLPSGGLGAAGALFEVALLADGVDPAQLYPLDWDRAFTSLNRIKPHIVKWWTTGAESLQLIADKQATALGAWNGRIAAARDQGVKVSGVWNQGVLQWSAWAVPKGAENVENAMKFIAFVGRAEPQAKLAELFLSAPVNSQAYKLLGADRTKLLPTAPELAKLQVVQNYEWWGTVENGAANDQRAIVEWEKWLAGAR